MSVGLVFIDIRNDYFPGRKDGIGRDGFRTVSYSQSEGIGEILRKKTRGVVHSPRILGMRRRSDQVYFDDTGRRDDPEMR